MPSDFEKYLQNLMKEEKAQRQKEMQEEKAESWQAAKNQLIELLSYNGSGSTADNNGVTYPNYQFANVLTKLIREMEEAGLDPYADPDIQRMVQTASSDDFGWVLPQNAGVDWNRFANDYSDQQYINNLKQNYEGWNLGFDPDNPPAGVTPETLARMQLAPLLNGQEEPPHGPENWSDLQNGWHYDDEGNWVGGSVYTPGTNPFVQYGLRDSYGAQTQDENGNWVDAPNVRIGRTDPAQRRMPVGRVTPEMLRDAARNGTPNWTSDEYDDINTRVSGDGTGASWTGEGEDYRRQLSDAMNGRSGGQWYNDNGYYMEMTGAGASPRNPGVGAGYGAGGTGYGTGAGAGASTSPGGAVYRGTGGASVQQDAYRAMLDALVRGSNGGMTTSTGLSAANKIYDNLGEITDPRPAYEMYSAAAGNPLKRDKDYDYLNRLIKNK